MRDKFASRFILASMLVGLVTAFGLAYSLASHAEQKVSQHANQRAALLAELSR